MKRCSSLILILTVTGNFNQINGQGGKDSPHKNSDAVLARRVDGYDLKDLATSGAFLESLRTARAPGGIITVLGCQREAITQRWKPSGYPLRQVLDWMVQTDALYRWTSDDGVINLVPAQGEPEILKTQIKFVETKNSKFPGSVVRRLLASPEIIEALSRLGLRERLRAVVWPVD